MAISAAISSSPPPFFSTKLQSSPASSSSSSCKLLANHFPANEVISILAGKEAVELASAALQAAREAVSITNYGFGSEEFGFHREDERDGIDDFARRRKKRRKRRKGFAYSPTEDAKDARFHSSLSRPMNDGYLTPIEVAQFCQFLKIAWIEVSGESLEDETRLEETRRSIAEIQQHEPTSQQLAKATRMKCSSVNKIMHKGRVSRAIIIHNYRRLVASIANAYRGKGLSIQDLIQEGSIGLLRGAEKFDPKRGSKLSTYVYWWIREAIISSISNKSRIVRLPGSMQDKIGKIREAKMVLWERLGRSPSYDEIADMLNVHVSTVALGCQMHRSSTVSLDRTVSDQRSITLQEVIAGPEEILPEKMVKKRLMKEELEKLLETISEREARLLRLRFGLNGQTPESHKEIGRSMKLTRERIRQLCKLALSNLRRRINMDELKVYIV